MPWIESHTELVHHPKLLNLANITEWTPNECIGTLHRLWWWALAYAEDGRLEKYNPAAISNAIGALVNEKYSHEKFFKVMIDAEFIDKDLKIHDWWDYAGKYITSKYKNNHPEIIKKIQRVYKRTKGQSIGRPIGRPITGQKNTHQPTYLPTYLNQPTNQHFECALEEILANCKNNLTTLILSDKFISSYIEWTLYKKKIKSPVTENSIHKQLDKLSKYGVATAIAMIDQSIENEWKGLFELNNKKNKDNILRAADGSELGIL